MSTKDIENGFLWSTKGIGNRALLSNTLLSANLVAYLEN